MRAIASRGTRVTKLSKVYPSKTFPTHLSVATGLYATGHGAVDNSFCRSGLIANAWAVAGGTSVCWWAHRSGFLLSNKTGAPRRFPGLNQTRLLLKPCPRTTAFIMAAFRMEREWRR